MIVQNRRTGTPIYSPIQVSLQIIPHSLGVPPRYLCRLMWTSEELETPIWICPSSWSAKISRFAKPERRAEVTIGFPRVIISRTGSTTRHLYDSSDPLKPSPLHPRSRPQKLRTLQNECERWSNCMDSQTNTRIPAITEISMQNLGDSRTSSTRHLVLRVTVGIGGEKNLEALSKPGEIVISSDRSKDARLMMHGTEDQAEAPARARRERRCIAAVVNVLEAPRRIITFRHEAKA